ncbi:hypothetical protein ACIGB8_12040 [Promicromonospora sukumoe]|uniref:hypothetical protein n=1 Tax=Promicromonospora sukumoe TaxID=88382 RepID=UPI0037C878C5
MTEDEPTNTSNSPTSGASAGASAQAVRALQARSAVHGQARPLLYGIVIGAVAGAVLTATIGLVSGASREPVADEAMSEVNEQLTNENADLRAQIEALAQAEGGESDASSTSSPSSSAGGTGDASEDASADAPAVYRVSNAPVKLEDGECLDPDSAAEDWSRSADGGESNVCFRNSGDGRRSLVYANNVLLLDKHGPNVQAADYGACSVERQATGFVELSADSMSSENYGLCLETGSGRTAHADVILPETDYAEPVEYVEVLLTVWDETD